jgi:hypothetical protein
MLQRHTPTRRLHTAAAADPVPPSYDYTTGSRVMTCDGHLGTVEAVAEGPLPGTETYDVRLDGGMGGGSYLPGQLSPVHTAGAAGTAAEDYPELVQVLAEHPDPARGMLARTAARGGCTECGDDLGSSAFPSCSACASYTHHGNCCPRTESTPGMDDVVRNIDALHRGLQLRLPDDLHHFANDPEGDRSAQAHSLVDHIARTGDEAHAHGLGLSWTDDPDFARDYAYGRPGTTSVILHAKPPAPEHVENDRAALADYPGSPARYQGKDWPEIPLKRDAPVHLTGLSWRTDGDGPRWRHHDFGGTGAPHHAATDRAERTPIGQSWWSTYDDPDATRSASARLASAEMSLGETIAPDRIPGPGPTKPRSPSDNPASSGWASGPDPDQWSSAPLYPLDSRVGAVSSLMNHGGECPHCFAQPGEEHFDICPAVTGKPMPKAGCPNCGDPGHGWERGDCPLENAIDSRVHEFGQQSRQVGHDFQWGKDVKDEHGHLSHRTAWCPGCNTEAHIGPSSVTLHGPAAPSTQIGQAVTLHHGPAAGGIPPCFTEGPPIRFRDDHGELRRCEGCGQHLMGEACRHCGSDEHHSDCCPGHHDDDGGGGGGGWDDDGSGGPDPAPGGASMAPTYQRSDLGLAATLHRADAEATLHEEPEAALPSTDGQINADDADPEALSPQGFTAFLADFQAKAAHLDPRRSAGTADRDIASAAKAHLAGLAKTGAYDFTPGQRRELIEEAPGVQAANADRLDLTGTHYADMHPADGEEEDGSWLI